MAKVPFSKLNLKINDAKSIISWQIGENNISFEVKQYLPVKDKIELISNIVNNSMDENGYYNPVRLKIYTVLETLYMYTNLNFTDKMKEDPFKTYDLIISTGLWNSILAVLPKSEWEEINNQSQQVITNIYHYRNSAMGIMQMIATDYSNLNLEAQTIRDALADENNLSFLRKVVTELG